MELSLSSTIRLEIKGLHVLSKVTELEDGIYSQMNQISEFPELRFLTTGQFFPQTLHSPAEIDFSEWGF